MGWSLARGADTGEDINDEQHKRTEHEMDHLHSDLGNVGGGTVVEFKLRSRAVVRLLDSSNYSAYRSGLRCRFQGGEAVRTPVRLSVPHAGHWHAVVDLNGHAGNVSASISVLAA